MMQGYRRNWMLALFVLSVVLLVLGYFYWAYESDEGDRASGGQDRAAIPVTIAISENYIGSGLVYLAQERGYFAQAGLDVTLQLHSSGRDALAAVHQQQADLGTTGDVPLMFAALQDWPLQNVASIFSAGGAHGIVARRDRGIAHPRELAGKRIGVTPGTDSDYVLSVVLADQGLEREVVSSLALRPEAMAEALAQGDVDAVSTWQPWLGMAEGILAAEQGVLFLPESVFRFDFSLSAQTDWIAANPDTLERVLQALLDAADWAEHAPLAARELILSATASEPDIFAPGGPDYRFQVALTQGQLIMLDNLARWALRSGLSEREVLPNMLDMIALDALARLRPNAVTVVR